MRTRSLLGVMASLAVIAGACSSSATPSPSSAAPASQAPASAPASQAAASGSAPASQAAAPSGPAPIASIGPGEGELDIVIWAGYAEPSNVRQDGYDWVNPFEKANPDCAKVNAKTADTSDDMYTLMTQGHGQYDGVSASGDASNRLIEAGEIAPVDPSLFPDFKDLSDFLQSPPHNTVNGVHYGVSHGWGGNTLMYRTDKVNPAPISWSAVFDPTEAAKYAGKITDYGGTIYIADAALYLRDHKPDLGITDPYELTQPQFDAAIALLKAQHQFVGKYWTSYSDEIDNFTNGQSLLGTTWQYQTNALLASGVKVAAVVPSEGMTGWADTWMLSTTRQAPQLHAQVDGLDDHAPGAGPGGRVLRRGPGQSEGLRHPRQAGWRGLVLDPELLPGVSRHGSQLLRQDRLLEDTFCGLRRLPRQDVHPLRPVAPGLDGREGRLSLSESKRSKAGATTAPAFSSRWAEA